ncbi:MAG: trans-2-enoyl-CoA reductase family protein [Gammaproteobacteria bacterium]|nr:trans-2-enoyl-CoA reductase family protein [Gammaproteobacteria bacterium]
MIVKPRIRGFICTTAHPLGCAANIREQVEVTQKLGGVEGCNSALVVGCSGGYGLASRIVAGFGCSADTVGVSFEKPPESGRPASAGWYNNAAFDLLANEAGLRSASFDGDAFSHAIKRQVIDELKANYEPIDLLVYSLAPPIRVHPDTGERFRSVIKPIGEAYEARTLTLDVLKGTGRLTPVSLEPASEEETAATIAVMGGDDWRMWVDQCAAEGVLSADFKTIAFTYLGNDLTYPIYRGGTLGQAKEHLDRTCRELNAQYGSRGAEALVAVLKAVVTQASTAIPVVPLYFSILFKVMKAAGTHEDCIAHINRLFREQLYGAASRRSDDEDRIRMDNYEMEEATQEEVRQRWWDINEENLGELADVDGFAKDFLKIFGFGRDDVDYDAELSDLASVVRS